jgi:hypothetical protein
MKSLNPKIVEDKREEEARRIRDNQTIRWTQIHPHHRTYQENSNLVTDMGIAIACVGQPFSPFLIWKKGVTWLPLLNSFRM